VTFYLRDLAASYHSYYDAERILVDDEAVKKARLALVAATAQVLHNGLRRAISHSEESERLQRVLRNYCGATLYQSGDPCGGV
jgi:hypothetical protein